MSSRPLVLVAAACCGLLGAGLVATEISDTEGLRVAVGVLCAVLVGVGLSARLALGAEGRRARRALREARSPAASPAAAGEAAPGGRQALAGTVLLVAGVVTGLLVVRSILGVSFWALLLLGAGGFVLWAQTTELPDEDGPGVVSGWQRALGRRPGRGDGREAGRDGLLLASGIGLVVLGALIALSSLGALDASRNGIVQLLVAVVALGLVVAPFWRRSARRAQTERTERIRGDERDEVAAHLHDSVLQTLALIQRRSDDPREVAGLARRQERELRTWLSGRSDRPDDELMAALRAAAAAVEVEHRVEIEVVTSGARPLDDRTAALVAAAREAMANAARHAGSETVSVFAEAEDDRVEVFVRDRGRGFDPAGVPADRRGVRESIVGRMRRAGGSATIHSSPGDGTEIELQLEDQ